MAKFIVTLLCLVSYQFLVRRTWVGVMLNGCRYGIVLDPLLPGQRVSVAAFDTVES